MDDVVKLHEAHFREKKRIMTNANLEGRSSINALAHVIKKHREGFVANKMHERLARYITEKVFNTDEKKRGLLIILTSRRPPFSQVEKY